jgi:hypothetical protein
MVSITVNSLEEINQWLAGYGLTAGSGDDSDGDTISNAVEFVIGGNPANRPDAGLLPTISTNANYLLFTYRRSDLARDDPSTSINVQWATGLSGPWTNAVNGTSGVVIVEQNDAAGAGIDLVTVSIPRSLAANGKLFARLGVAVSTP